jgi:putative membrane protein insertion efficiency factor
MKKQETYKIEIDDVIFECHVDASLMPGVRRALTGTTPMDSEIDRLPVPERPIWLVLATKAFRWYRRVVAPRIGNRCVFEPSCSHYSELAFRKHGFLLGLNLTIRRLFRCRPGTGGLDVP